MGCDPEAACPAGCASTTGAIGGHAALINNLPLQNAQQLPRAPSTTLGGDVGAALFVGVRWMSLDMWSRAVDAGA